MFDTLVEEEAWVYNFFYWGTGFFLKYFEVLLTSFRDLAGIGEGINEIVAGLIVFLSLSLVIVLIGCGLNLDFTMFLNEVFDSSTAKLFQCAL